MFCINSYSSNNIAILLTIISPMLFNVAYCSRQCDIIRIPNTYKSAIPSHRWSTDSHSQNIFSISHFSSISLSFSFLRVDCQSFQAREIVDFLVQDLKDNLKSSREWNGEIFISSVLRTRSVSVQLLIRNTRSIGSIQYYACIADGIGVINSMYINIKYFRYCLWVVDELNIPILRLLCAIHIFYLYLMQYVYLYAHAMITISHIKCTYLFMTDDSIGYGLG